MASNGYATSSLIIDGMTLRVSAMPRDLSATVCLEESVRGVNELSCDNGDGDFGWLSGSDVLP
jgi:hypothetical protein